MPVDFKNIRSNSGKLLRKNHEEYYNNIETIIINQAKKFCNLGLDYDEIVTEVAIIFRNSCNNIYYKDFHQSENFEENSTRLVNSIIKKYLNIS